MPHDEFTALRRTVARRAHPSSTGITLAALALLAGCAQPVPDGEGLDAVPVFAGTPARPDPLTPKDVPMHPFLAEQSAFHDDHYNSDTTDFPAPLGLAPRVRSRAYSLCGTPRVDSQGRIVTQCGNPAFAVDPAAPPSLLYLLDGDTLDVLAATEFITGEFTGDEIGGGNYPHVLADDTVINGGISGFLEQYALVEDGDGLRWEFTQPQDFRAGIPAGDALFDVMPDFDNRYWYATVGGDAVGGVTVGVVEEVGVGLEPKTTFLAGEQVENGLAVGEDGVYVLTTEALYAFNVNDAGEPVQRWREAYDSVPKPPESGLFSEGSGSTPTLLGREYVAITDNDAPRVNLLVFKRGDDVVGERLVCKVPLFAPDASANDLSVIGHERSLVVTNWYGAAPPIEIAPGMTVPPLISDFRGLAGGMTRVDVREDESGCDVVWENPDIRTTSVPKLSTTTGLIYLLGQRIDDITEAQTPPIDAYYMQTVSMATGEIAFEVLTGTGPYAAGGGLTTTIGPNGAFYQATAGGLHKVQDEAEGARYWVRYRRMLISPAYREFWAALSEQYSLERTREEDIRRTDCNQETLLTSVLALLGGGLPVCDVFGSP